MGSKTRAKEKETLKEEISVADPGDMVAIPPENIDPGIKANVDAANAGKDFVALAKECLEIAEKECKDEKGNSRFWEVIRDEAVKQVGPSVRFTEGMKPMSDGRKSDFLKEEMPYGQYEGKRVSYVLKKDPSYLERFAKQPHPFQKDLMRFFVSQSQEPSKKK